MFNTDKVSTDFDLLARLCSDCAWIIFVHVGGFMVYVHDIFFLVLDVYVVSQVTSCTFF